MPPPAARHGAATRPDRTQDLASETFYAATVEASWLDSLDHVNFLEYQRAADKATDGFWIAVGGEMAAAGRSTLSIVIVETHARYLRELRLGDAIEIRTRIISFDRRRIHLEHTLLRGEDVSCVIGVLGLAFDIVARTASHWPEPMLLAFAARCEQPRVERVGALIPG